jgi:hypothetical protein
VRTTRYDATIDIERLVTEASDRERFADLETKDGGLAGIPAAVWLDGRGLPRRIQLQRLGWTDTWEYYDFGVQARIALPLASKIMSLDELDAFTTGTQ